MNYSCSNSSRPARGWPAALVLLVSLGLVLFWQIMALRAARGFEAFELSARQFQDFKPDFENYRVVPMAVSSSPAEPNLVAYLVYGNADEKGPVFVRLAHGYNLRDCMRYRGYSVELLEDIRVSAAGLGPRVQIWHLTDTVGEVSLWVSSMLRTADYTPVDTDVRSMPFPAIGVALDPGFQLRGITWSSLRNPVRNFRVYMQARWNNARRDLATFLRLRRPAWASDEVLTLVTGSLPESTAANAAGILGRRDEIMSRHLRMISELQKLAVSKSNPER